MANMAIMLNTMAVRDLFLSINIDMFAMFLRDLFVGVFIRMQGLKQHCKQYCKRHQKINPYNFLFHS